MAKNDNLTHYLIDIADAIREKNGTTDLINAQDFAEAILFDPNKTLEEKEVTFYDIDGRILYSYDAEEFLSMNSFPADPVRSNLIFQEWNWPLDKAKEFVEEYGVLKIGATYKTIDDKTRLYINTISAEVSLSFIQTVPNGVTVDWGDGYSNSSSEENVTLNHTYIKGEYVVTLDVAENCDCTISFDESSLFNSSITNIELGRNVEVIEMCSQISITYVMFPPSYKYNLYLYDPSNKHFFVNVPYNVKVDRVYQVQAILPYNFQSISQCDIDMTRNKYCIMYPNVRYYNSDFNKYLMERLVILEGVTSLVNNLNSCYKMTYVKLPSTLVNIQTSQAFGWWYFMKCYDFTNHTVVPTLRSVNNFDGIPEDCKIVVPDVLYDEWIVTTNWSVLANNIIKASDYYDN